MSPGTAALPATQFDRIVRKYFPELETDQAYLKRALPKLAKQAAIAGKLDNALAEISTRHLLVRGDARALDCIDDCSVQLVLTSPPYWTLKQYNHGAGQLGYISDYESFLDELDRVWSECFRALVPGGRLIIVVGDVCLSRKEHGRHVVVPLHASIQERCRRLGFDNLAPIIWHKIANARLEVENGSGGFLGKPYEPNAVIKNDIEYVLMQRKPGAYRSPAPSVRVLSLIAEQLHRTWFRQVWTLPGASTRAHPAPYPLALAQRLVRMFSFAGDTVLDPFMGTATTNLAAALSGRSSIGYEIDPAYFTLATNRVQSKAQELFRAISVETSEQSPVRRPDLL